MSDKYFEETRESTLRTWVLGRMLAGAGWGAVFVVVIGVFLGVIWLISQLLPDASKEAPSPYGFVIETPAETAQV